SRSPFQLLSNPQRVAIAVPCGGWNGSVPSTQLWGEHLHQVVHFLNEVLPSTRSGENLAGQWLLSRPVHLPHHPTSPFSKQFKVPDCVEIEWAVHQVHLQLGTG